ncbi:MAG TPA: hypothetical protein DEQ96_00275 [Fusobacterium sp.]|uniref:Uncharacterized protein n=2 Tax=Fusobacteriaceae TaxID=203492 RepID=A0A323TZD9_FUSNU|nr:hypothetical protein CQA79_11260 [Fusobacterium nucleatum]PZA05343.1 hypothetical protein DNF10_00405 [Fusobacterium nucleatum]QJX50415.1 hypothetical protein HOO60_05845 [Fusobacterium nucleatum]HCE31559.1 hypothetical protein [Fusobacterium sp.]
MIFMSNIINPDPLEFKKLEKERVIKELEKAIKKAEVEGRIEDVEKLKKELKDLTHESFLEKLIKDSIRY